MTKTLEIFDAAVAAHIPSHAGLILQYGFRNGGCPGPTTDDGYATRKTGRDAGGRGGLEENVDGFQDRHKKIV